MIMLLFVAADSALLKPDHENPIIGYHSMQNHSTTANNKQDSASTHNNCNSVAVTQESFLVSRKRLFSLSV